MMRMRAPGIVLIAYLALPGSFHATAAAQSVAQNNPQNVAQAAMGGGSTSTAAVRNGYRKLIHMHHTVWRERDGIPVAGVSSIQRTPDGYLWLGTVDALIRFDGVRFVRFDASNTPAFRSGNGGPVIPLLLDSRGTLWISRPDGALITYRDRQFVQTVVADTVRGRTTSMAEASDGTIWAKSRRLYTLRDGRIAKAPVPNGLETRVLGLRNDRKGRVWIGTEDGELWSWYHDSLSHFKSDPTNVEPVRVVAAPDDGSIWILQTGIERIANGRRTSLRAPQSKIDLNGTGAGVMSDGSIVFGTRGNGVLRWKDGKVDAMSEPQGLSDAVVRDVFVDADENIWIATDVGLDRLRYAPFVTIGENDGIAIPSASLLVGTPDGAVWSKAAGTVDIYRMSGGIIDGDRSAVYGDIKVERAKLSSDTNVRAALHSAAGRDGILLGNARRELFLYRSRRLTPFRAEGLPTGIVQQTIVDTAGAVWIASLPEGVTVVRKGKARAIGSGATRRTATGMALAENGDVWATLSQPPAVVRIHNDSVVDEFAVQNADAPSAARPVFEGRDTLWAISGGSLIRVANGHLSRVYAGALDPVLRSASLAMIPSHGYLWMASGVGICRVRFSELHDLADGRTSTQPAIEWFGTVDGLINAKLTSTNRPAAFKGADGRLWFSTPSGIAMVDPSEIKRPGRQPQVHIEEVIVSGKQVSEARHDVNVSPHPDRIEIHFTATELSIPERVRLQYRLDGADKAWADANATRLATYTQLRHGNYKFRVRTLDDSDVPGPETVMKLQVLPLWYESAWFGPLLFFVIATAGSILVYVAFRTRTRIVADRMRARFEAESAERARLARELHDTLLQGFTGITLQLQAVRKSVVHSPEHAQHALDRILATADVSLREARTMVWDMRAPELDDQSLAEAVRSVVRSAVGDSEISSQVTVTGNERKLPLGIETAVLRVAREAMANAVQHARARRVDIRVIYSDRLVTLTVSDNGAGFDERSLDAKANGGHWGLKGMQERAIRARGELRIRSRLGEGTTVELELPTSHLE